jgi:altronate dehydratase small subunit
MSIALKVHEKDNVATCLKSLAKGETVDAGGAKVSAAADVAVFHKIAVTDIKKGDLCYKYGQVLRRALNDINPGDHVHVHNIESTRGRGDQVKA